MNFIRTYSQFLTLKFSRHFQGSESDTHRALIIFYMTLAVIVFSIGFGTYFILNDLHFGTLTCTVGIISAALDLIFLLILRKIGLAGHFFCLATAFFFTLSIYLTDGIHSPYVPWLVMAPVTASILFGLRETLIWAIVALLEIIAWRVFRGTGIEGDPTMFFSAKSEVILIANMGLYVYTILLIISAERVRTDLHRLRRLISADEQQQASSLTQALQGRELERQRISRELHDGLNNILTAVRLRHQVSLQKAAPYDTEIHDFLHKMDQLSARVGRMSEDLSVHVLQDFGLANGIRYLVSRFELDSEASVSHYVQEEVIPDRFSLPIYRMLQECLQNAIHPTQAREATLQVLCLENLIRIMVEADGKGFSDYEKTTLLSEKLRETNDYVRVFEGELLLDTAPGRGFSLIIEIPYSHE